MEQINKIYPTPKQLKLLNFLKKFLKTHNYMPSYREIADHLSYKSKNSAYVMVNNLIDKGYIAKPIPKQPRGITINKYIHNGKEKTY